MLDIDMDKVRSLRSAGRTYQEIAQVFGCSYGTLRRRLNPVVAEKDRERYEQTEKARRQANPEGNRQASKKWEAANPEKRRVAARARYAANPEIWRERNHRNRQDNLEATRARGRERYAANPDIYRERMRLHRLNNPDIYRERAQKQAQRRLQDLQYRFDAPRRAAKRAHERKGLPYEDVDLAELCARDNWACQICGGPVDREIAEFGHPWGMSFDHVLPESQGGGWTWDNLQLTHRGCNIMRGSLPLDVAREFAREFLKRLAGLSGQMRRTHITYP